MVAKIQINTVICNYSLAKMEKGTLFAILENLFYLLIGLGQAVLA